MHRGEDTGAFVERAGRHESVTALWSYTMRVPAQRLVPEDGCFDLIVLDSPRGVTALVHRPRLRAHVAVLPARVRALGVRLAPGHGRSALASGLVHRAVRCVVRGGALDDLEELVADVAVAPPLIVRDLVAAARVHSGRLRLTADRGAVERERQRACRAWLGMPAKTFLRIERAHAAARCLRAGAPIAETAAELGFSDQAHLTRELGTLLGTTPRRLVGNLQDGARSPA